MKKDKTEAMTEATEIEATPKSARTKTGEFATQIFVFFADPVSDGERGMTSFASKADLDVWLKETNVQILRVIRGREKRISSRIVFQ